MRPVILVILVLPMFALPAWAGWLPTDRYQAMNMIERRQFDAARKRYEAKQFVSAAAEFEKFKVQFPSCSALPYAVLYHGLSLHGGNYRHKAIRVYQEVIDYFATDSDPAAKAQFQIGQAYHDNGDDRRSLLAMRLLADHKIWSQHAIAAGAIRRLADRHLRDGDELAAQRRWKQVLRDFRETNKHEAGICRDRLADYYVRRGQFAEFASWYRKEYEDQEKVEFALAQDAYDRITRGLWDKHKKWGLAGEKHEPLVRMFTAFYREAEPGYIEAGKAWEYHSRMVKMVSRGLRNPRETQLAIDEATASLEKDLAANGESWAYHTRVIALAIYYIKKDDETDGALNRVLAYIASEPKHAWARYQALWTTIQRKFGDHEYSLRVLGAAAKSIAAEDITSVRDDRYLWVAAGYGEIGDGNRAVEYVGKVEHVPRRKFILHQMLGSQGRWTEAVELLKQVEATNDGEFSPKAREARAAAYRLHLQEYAQAISLYYEIDDPPRTLWDIQDCYWRWKKLDEACAILREIEAVFPKQGPAAAWKRVEYYEKKKLKEKAVAGARRILKIYPKSKQSSQAHQFLEKHGVATGGGLDE